MNKLYAGRFSGNITNGSMLESFNSIERLGIRWNIESFGIERIEVTVKTKGPIDQYNRMNTGFGGTTQTCPGSVFLIATCTNV
jgi:hypothetical protein